MTVAPDRSPTLLELAGELLLGRTHDLDRDPDDEDAREALAITARLRDRHAALLRAGQPAQARRVLARLIDHERRRQARAAASLLRHGAVPSLLDQVREAVTSSSGNGHRGSAGPHRSPIGLSAAELLGAIEREVGHRYTGPLDRDVWAWVNGHTAAPWAVDTMAGWVSRARAVVDPPRPVSLAAACPQCGRSVVHVEDSGERVRRAALQVDRTTGTAACIAPGCDAVWTPDRWAFLAAVLEQQTREERDPTTPRRQVRRVSSPAAGRVSVAS